MEKSTACRSGAIPCTKELINKIKEITKNGPIEEDISEEISQNIPEDNDEEIDSQNEEELDVEEDVEEDAEEDVKEDVEEEKKFEDEIDDTNYALEEVSEAIDESEENKKEQDESNCWETKFGFRCCNKKVHKPYYQKEKYSKWGFTNDRYFWCEISKKKN